MGRLKILGRIVAVMLPLLGSTAASSQTGWSQQAACPGWNNPVGFSDGYSGRTGSRMLGAVQLNTNVAASMMATTVSPSTCTSPLPSPNHLFEIIADLNGFDPNTDGGLPYVPTRFSNDAAALDEYSTRIVRSIRIGDGCSGNPTAASLRYTMQVTAQNALLSLYYALVYDSPTHGETESPLFEVKVMRKNAVTGQFDPVSDTLEYSLPVVATSITLQADSSDRGWHRAGTVYYRDWDKVMFDLSPYLYDSIRIEVTATDCAWGAHFGYAYIAGECRPLSLATAPCDGAEATALAAPTGMQSYRWLASQWGMAAGYADQASATYRPLTDTLHGDSASRYVVQSNDYLITRRLSASGDTVACDSMGRCQTFCCEMTSALDPSKPITSRIYFNACIPEWRMLTEVDSLLDCTAGTATVWNRSILVSETDTLLPDQTTWNLYAGTQFDGSPYQTLAGDSITIAFGPLDTIGVLMRTHSTFSGCSREVPLILIRPQQPTIAVNGFRYLSMGTTSNITATSDIACTFQWSTAPDTIRGDLPAGPALQVVMTSSPITYYVLATTGRGCMVWDSVTLHAGLRDTTLANLFSQINIDSVLCMNQTQTVRIGHSAVNEVVVSDYKATLSHADRVFLPDGIPCDGRCTYRSPLTFDNFMPGQTVNSVEEIVYVRLNIEHSYIGDLYVGITCPNGQHATIMRFNGNSSPCLDTIPLGSRNWLPNPAGSGNVPGSTHFGIPYTSTSSSIDKCDSTLPDNAPGTGWNYCWSNNSTTGITYAPGDGIIYRIGNSNGFSIDSSDVNARTQFYHPDQDFSALIGCPLNGTWAIEVIDGFSGDNGYIFDWELSLDASVVAGDITIIGSNVIGNDVGHVNDSTYVLGAPAGCENDTTVAYIIQLYDSLGVVADTVVNIHYLAIQHHLEAHKACQGDTVWVGSEAFTETTHRLDSTTNATGCLEITEIDILFHPSYDLSVRAEFCPHERLEWNGTMYASTGDYTLHDHTAEGCDSITHLTVALVDSGFYAAMAISHDGETWSSDTMLADCAPFAIYAADISPLGYRRRWAMGDGTLLADSLVSHTYDSAGIYDILLAAEAQNGCRDTAYLKRAVWVYPSAKAAFTWTPDEIPMSHPTVQLVNLSDTADSHFWLATRTDGMGADTLYDAHPTYTWGGGTENLYGDYDISLHTLLMHINPYGDTLHCHDSITHPITIVNDWLQFPNLVSPNGDGTNDRWEVVNLLECGMYAMNELWIYDHWGALVYHVRNISSADDFWDPASTRSPDGTYYFRFAAQSPFGLVRRNGTIEVLR